MVLTKRRGELMPIDYNKLRGKIVEKYKTQSNFAKAMGLSERTLSLKMNNEVGWKQTEILKAAELLDIIKEEINNYFFTYKVKDV